MKKLMLSMASWSIALSGCVLGYGHCLLLEPLKTHLAGTLHYRKFPVTDGMDDVPILVLDRTAYIYSPATSKQCVSANEVQLLPLTDLPESVHDSAKLEIRGSIALAADAHQHTRFIMNVDTFRVLK
jgi:hypothetical protein